ncbi:MAG: cytochrome P450 [Planctomycetota bacterium]
MSAMSSNCPHLSADGVAPPPAGVPAGASSAAPEPGDLPVTQGSLADFARDVLGGLLQLHADHGPVAALEDGGQRVVFSFDPAVNKQVLGDTKSYDARFFAVRGPKRSSQRRVTSGLLGMNGDQWKRNRRLLRDSFGPKQIASYRPTIARLAEETAAAWKPGDTMDFNEEMVRYMLRVTSTLLFGMSGSDDDRRLAYEVGEQIAEWGQLNHEVGIGALVPDATFSSRYEELLEFAESLEAQTMEMITRRRRSPERGNDVLSILVRTNEDGESLTDEELVGQSCVLFAAAHLTTAHSFTWTTFLISQHPEVMRRLEQEFAALDPAGKHDAQSYPERLIRESMRLLPASSYSQRINNEAVDIGPFKELPRGTPIVFSPFITHRLESVYERPQRFNPDRWLTYRPNGYDYIPFGAGPRRCIGGPLALEVIRTSLPIFLRGRGFRVEPGAEINAEIRSTMLHPTSGMPMTVVEAGDYGRSPFTGRVAELVDLPA